MAVLILKRDPNASGEEFYLVHHADRVVGRIFRRQLFPGAPENMRWFWGLSHDPEHGVRDACYGHTTTREEAMAALRAAWNEIQRDR